MNVLMPQLGETVSSGRITTWFKSVGDAVASGEDLFEVECDKVTMEVPATVAGTLAEIRVGDGIEAPVGAIVAIIATADSLPAQQSALETQPSVPVWLDPFREVRTAERNYGSARLSDGARITPLARRRAVEAGVDRSTLLGSGPEGRVTKIDVERARTAGNGSPAAARAQIASSSAYREIPLSAARRVIAKRLTESKQGIPHFYLTVICTIDKLLALRNEINGSRKARGVDATVSVNDLVIKAAAIALRQVPAANVSFADAAIREYMDVDISVAVATPDGLMTPIVRKADAKTLDQISAEMKDLAARAREGTLKPDEFLGGAFTISNLGMYGVQQFAAIINPPQCCILAIGAGEQRAVVVAGRVEVATQMSCTLSVDHRAIDGAVGARFLQSFKAVVEDPRTLLAVAGARSA